MSSPRSSAKWAASGPARTTEDMPFLIAAALLVSLAFAGPQASSSALGPYPGLGGCPVFPKPPRSVGPRAPSLPTQAAWNQNIARAPVHPRSRAIIAYINRHGDSLLHPDFGSPRSYGFPYAVVGRS